jgi:peptidoglycan-associated lipoprotein
MQKLKSTYVVALFLVALFMIAGCATENVVKKDEGMVPAPAAKQAVQQKSTAAQSNQVAALPIAPAASSTDPAQQNQKSKSNARLQSALEKIYFDFDSSTLSDSARGTLTNKNAALIKGSTANIRIEGNCDESGSTEYNLALGERRAKSAQQYLVALGVKPERLSTISYGKEKPAAQGSDESTLAKNRRDEFVVLAK